MQVKVHKEFSNTAVHFQVAKFPEDLVPTYYRRSLAPCITCNPLPTESPHIFCSHTTIHMIAHANLCLLSPPPPLTPSPLSLPLSPSLLSPFYSPLLSPLSSPSPLSLPLSSLAYPMADPDIDGTQFAVWTGSHVRLQCEFPKGQLSAQYTYTWYKDGNQITGTDPTLQIISAGAMDNGIYQCKVSVINTLSVNMLPFERMGRSIELNVYSKFDVHSQGPVCAIPGLGGRMSTLRCFSYSPQFSPNHI